MPRQEESEEETIKAEKAVVNIKSTFNNTLISAANENGDVFTWSSGGRIGFKGTRKGTPYAAQLAAREVAQEMAEIQINKADVHINGPGPGKEAAIRALKSEGVEVDKIYDVTPKPHSQQSIQNQ